MSRPRPQLLQRHWIGLLAPAVPVALAILAAWALVALFGLMASFPAHAGSPASAPDRAQLLARGKAVFDHSCVICHGNGPYMAGTQQLRINYGKSEPALLEQRTDLTPAIVKVFVRRGYGIMPRFRKTEVSDADLDAVATYLSRNNPAAAKGDHEAANTRAP